ncbi:3-deoxy-D-manno-octulosonic acid transferase [Candidatus Kinetoplastidibacterium blastocrithidiae]|uniref:3-deoxy-D-manno-octulosonic acid transferase n=1 Tax=Candidatus Kinetoplastidibacterium blastocrithidiae TaxID=233181 RepID=UPI001CEFAD17|nr:glycosyltransferase N-terminal domain-containing protein [Candidatus Kinetoplastibacterium blastocrithidii]
MFYIRDKKTRKTIFYAERFGFYNENKINIHQCKKGKIAWIHAASIGELKASYPLIRHLLDRGLLILITGNTYSFKEEGQRLFCNETMSKRIMLVFLPYDFPGSVQRFLRYYEPSLCIIIEREIWPNLLYYTHKYKVPIVLVNARLSKRSFTTMMRFRLIVPLSLENITLVMAQTISDAYLLKKAGALSPIVTGNIKFDISVPKYQIQKGAEFKKNIKKSIVLIASIRENEESIFIEHIKQCRKDEIIFLIVPRHEERFDIIADYLKKENITFERKSSISDGRSLNNISVILGDSMGEMFFYYGMTDVSIVAGSFAPLGGHNFIEACFANIPVIVGPHTFNFQDLSVDAEEFGVILRAINVKEAINMAKYLLEDSNKVSLMRESAKSWINSHRGSIDRVIREIEVFL